MELTEHEPITEYDVYRSYLGALRRRGPRIAIDQPTIYLGNRGAYPIDFWIDAREGGHHSGNWGGLLSNPAIELAHAIAPFQ